MARGSKETVETKWIRVRDGESRDDYDLSFRPSSTQRTPQYHTPTPRHVTQQQVLTTRGAKRTAETSMIRVRDGERYGRSRRRLKCFQKNTRRG
jgi:hypothetical protein